MVRAGDVHQIAQAMCINLTLVPDSLGGYWAYTLKVSTAGHGSKIAKSPLRSNVSERTKSSEPTGSLAIHGTSGGPSHKRHDPARALGVLRTCIGVNLICGLTTHRSSQAIHLLCCFAVVLVAIPRGVRQRGVAAMFAIVHVVTMTFEVDVAAGGANSIG